THTYVHIHMHIHIHIHIHIHTHTDTHTLAKLRRHQMPRPPEPSAVSHLTLFIVLGEEWGFGLGWGGVGWTGAEKPKLTPQQGRQAGQKILETKNKTQFM